MAEDDDQEVGRFTQRLDDWSGLSSEKRQELAFALLKRSPKDRADNGAQLLRREYPSAAQEMIQSAAFHAYMELPDALRDGLAWLELCLRERKHDQHAGINFEIIYHLYNWLQAETLVPWGQQDVFDALQEIKACLQGDDREGAVANLESLMERFDSSVAPPDVET